jgi:uncharacterized damage-inducible protein DinB
MLNWTKPDPSEMTSYQRAYADLVPEGDLSLLLENNAKSTSQLMSSLSSEKLKYRYAAGKWSIPQILVHIIDTERIFSYRILRIARGDKTPLPGYEQDDYAKESGADERDFKDIVEEFLNVRRSTVSLLKSLYSKQLLYTGTSNNNPVSVRTLCYMLAGHEIHHIKVVKEKYIN